MCTAVQQPVVQLANWTAILIAALGSSALGAIVGGYLPTRMRGRLEREEAWRTRLIEAADEFYRVLVGELRALGGLIFSVSIGDRPLWQEDGTLDSEIADAIKAALQLSDEAEIQLSRIELLFGSPSTVYQDGFKALHYVDRARGLLEGRKSAQTLVRAVVAERTNAGSGADLLEQEGQGDAVEPLLRIWAAAARRSDYKMPANVPEDFDPSDGSNVAQWARQLHLVSGEYAHRYSDAARAAIEGFKLNRPLRGAKPRHPR